MRRARCYLALSGEVDRENRSIRMLTKHLSLLVEVVLTGIGQVGKKGVMIADRLASSPLVVIRGSAELKRYHRGEELGCPNL